MSTIWSLDALKRIQKIIRDQEIQIKIKLQVSTNQPLNNWALKNKNHCKWRKKDLIKSLLHEKKTPARGILIISYVHCTGYLVYSIAWTPRAGNGTHCSHTFNIMLEWLAETVWWNKYKSRPPLLFFYSQLSRPQSLIRLFHFRYGPNTSSHCTW